MSTDTSPPPPPLQSAADLNAALRWGLLTATAHGARTITAVSPAFSEAWPWNEEPVLTALATWLRLPQRRLVLLAADYGSLSLRYPRFASWRRHWVHDVPAWICPEEMARCLGVALHDDQRLSVQVLDAESGRGLASLERRYQLQRAQESDVFLQRCTSAWPVNTLGL